MSSYFINYAQTPLIVQSPSLTKIANICIFHSLSYFIIIVGSALCQTCAEHFTSQVVLTSTVTVSRDILALTVSMSCLTLYPSTLQCQQQCIQCSDHHSNIVSDTCSHNLHSTTTIVQFRFLQIGIVGNSEQKYKFIGIICKHLIYSNLQIHKNLELTHKAWQLYSIMSGCSETVWPDLCLPLFP